jgi:hypothetical protein
MDTLAVQLTIPLVGFVGDFHSLVRTPCRAHSKKKVALASHFHYFNYRRPYIRNISSALVNSFEELR